MASTVVPRSLCAVLLSVALLGACSGENPYQSAQTAQGSDSSDSTIEGIDSNEFLPERSNASDCVGTVERPNCGSGSKGGWRMYLTFGVLIAGMSFIGWRVARSVRARDVAVNNSPGTRP
jgi:hypothetical protein